MEEQNIKQLANFLKEQSENPEIATYLNIIGKYSRDSYDATDVCDIVIMSGYINSLLELLPESKERKNYDVATQYICVDGQCYSEKNFLEAVGTVTQFNNITSTTNLTNTASATKGTEGIKTLFSKQNLGQDTVSQAREI